MRILVTGGTGFIGRRLVERLLEQGEYIHILCRSSSDISGLDHSRISRFPGDVTDQKTVEKAMQNCDRVYHLAALARNWAPDQDIFNRIMATFICESY